MPKLGMEPVRRDALIDATIREIGARGSLDVTVAQIAKRAGMSSALAHHYFGSKDRILLAAMRHILAVYGAEVRGGLAEAEGPRKRLDAVIAASFSMPNFRDDVVAAWLNFYVLARTHEDARRLLTVYQRRLRSNLLHDLRRLAPRQAEDIADAVGALIDGVYIREALTPGAPDAAAAVSMLRDHIDRAIRDGTP